ncbi:MAG: amidohydrolase family protein [Sedimentisphaerales bacterium]|nr:amidohydrolase family protein [Sedimentisphaerales bacterium]
MNHDITKAKTSKSIFFNIPVLLISTACPLFANAGDIPERLLLKQYRPNSIYNVPRTNIQKSRYPVIDMHSHTYAKSDKQILEWIRIMDEVGIEKTIILSGQTGEQFDETYKKYSRYPNRFEVWCGLDYTGYDKPGFGPAAVKELERCYKLGARGVGELGDKGKGLFYSRPVKAWGMHLDDKRMDPILEKCADLGMPVNIHVADPRWMYEPMDEKNDGLMNAYQWRLDNQPGIVGHEDMVKILGRAVERHPRTIFVACHFANCSDNLERLGKLFDKYPNLYADISARYAETAAIPRYTGRFYEKYQDRLVYGTDMGFGREMYRTTFRILESSDEHFYAWNYFSYHWPLHGLDLPDEVLRKVYRENAFKIIGTRSIKKVLF